MLISFPRSEHDQLKRRLSKGLPIYTTRVSSEKGKYQVGKTYMPPWGGLLMVEQVRSYKGIENHPFLNELSAAQIKIISHYGDYDLIKLKMQPYNARA